MATKKKKTKKSAPKAQGKKKGLKSTPSKKRATKKEKLVGEVTHYFSKIGVAVVKLRDTLKIGDKIRIVGGQRDFEQTVESMQIEHKDIQRAPKGKEIGLKVDQKVKEGDKVYKV